MNNPSKIEAKKVAHRALEKIFKVYEDKGIVSIYLWGSSTRDDFNPLFSDIDVLAITDERFDTAWRMDIKNELEKENPEIKEFGFQCVFQSELNGGERISLLVKLQAPGYLLKSFPEWEWVCGKKFGRDDFSVEDFATQQMIHHNIVEADRALSNLDDPGRKINANRIDLVKALLMLIHWRNVLHRGPHQLSIEKLPEISQKSDLATAKLLFEIRENRNYSKDEFDKFLPNLISFLNETRG